MTKDEAWKLAEHWISAWNAHDLDLIMTTTKMPSS
jgi:hypothetical protein